MDGWKGVTARGVPEAASIFGSWQRRGLLAGGHTIVPGLLAGLVLRF